MKRRLNSALYILLTALVVIGLPVALSSVAGWPLPTKVPNFANVSLAIRQQNIPSEVIINVLAVVLWLVWIQLVWSLIWELVYVGPKLSSGLQAKSAPLSTSPMQRLAARLIGGIMSVGLIATSLQPNSMLPTEFVPTQTADLEEFESEAIDVPAADEALVAGQMWRVMPGDSLWSISGGDEAVMNAIFEANVAVNTALDVEPGMDLIVPISLEVPTDRLIQHVAEAEVDVERGDHLWGLAESRLEEALPGNPSNSVVADYLQEVIDENPSVQPNPDLIHPNDRYTFPEVGAPAMKATQRVSIEGLPGESLARTGSHVGGEKAQLNGEHTVADQGIVSSLSSLLGSPRGIVLGAGLFGLFLQLQQGQLVRGATRSLRRRREGGGPGDLIKASKLPLVEWAGKELSKLMDDLGSRNEVDPAPRPQLLEVRLADGIEVVWQTPQMGSLKPWDVSPDGRRWKLPYRANARVIAGDLPAAFAALVTLGSRSLPGIASGNEGKKQEAVPVHEAVMVNLVDYGTMSIVGEPEHTTAAMRSLVLELGSSENMANAKVMLVDLEVDGIEQMRRVKTGETSEALALLRSVSLMADRSATAEAAIIFVGSESPNVQVLLAAAQAGSDCAVIVVGAAENVSRHFVIQANGREAFFLDNQADIVEPVAVTAAQAAEVAQTLNDAALDDADLGDWQINFDDGSVQAKAASIILQLGSIGRTEPVDGRGPSEAATATTINVFGQPEIPGVETSQGALAAVSLVLAQPTRTMKDSEVIDTIWGSGTITNKEFWREIEGLQQKLTSDAISRTSNDELVVSPSVRTDLEIFASYVSQAAAFGGDDELVLLLEALKLIGGVPFTGSPLCHWAYRPDTPLALQAIELVEATALRAAEIGIQSKSYAAADRAISQGLSGTGPNEPLLRMQMKVEAARGNIDGVEAVFHDFSAKLTENPWRESMAPSLETTDLRNQLVASES